MAFQAINPGSNPGGRTILLKTKGKTMKIKFRTEKRLRKLLYMYNLYGPPDSLPSGMREYPMFFGKEFFTGAKLYDLIFRNPKNKEKIFKSLIYGKPNDKKTRMLLTKLDGLDVAIERNDNDKFFKEVAESIGKELKAHSKETDAWAKRMFGMELPDEAIIIIGEGFNPNSGQGGMILEKNPIVLGYCVNPRDLDRPMLSVIVHEILHSLLGARGLIRREKGGAIFEEALLDYFAPYGILTENSGLGKKESIERYHEYNVRNRPSSREISSKLLPIMQRYQRSGYKKPIWSFLKEEKEFKKFLKIKEIDKIMSSYSKQKAKS